MTTKRDIMKIEVLATGCVRLNTTEAIIREALSQSDVDAQVVKVLDRMEIAKSEMHMTPAVIIDGQVKAVGKVLNRKGSELYCNECRRSIFLPLKKSEQRVAQPQWIRENFIGIHTS